MKSIFMITKYLLSIVFTLGILSSVGAQVLYVSEGAVGTGSSWADASGDLNQTLSLATAGTEIWVKAGVYYPINCTSCTDAQKNIPFEIPDSVAVYGGFLGNEINRSERNWENNKTNLSGDIDQDGLSTNNTQTIVHFTRVSSLTILDGFILKDGNASSPGSSMSERQNCGGAIFNQGGLNGSSSNPVIRNCVFSNNNALSSGGAVYSNSSFGGSANPIFENCTFLNNVCEKGGGAVYNQAFYSGSSFTEFLDCSFSNNSANQNSGGAVFNHASEDGDCGSSFVNCDFDGNYSSDYGGGVYGHGRKGKSNSFFENCTFINNEARFGGGVSNNGTENGESNSIFNNCLFENNHVTFDGAGVHNWGANNGLSNGEFTDCIFQNNNSDFAGAGMFNNGINGESNATIINCKFIENTATTYGGAIYNHGKKGDASATIINTLFLKNAGNSAGAVYNLGSENGNSSPHITNCTFFGNTANVGGAVYSNASDSTGTASPIITNCIFYKNKANFGNVFRNVLGTPFIQYSSVDELNCDDLNSGIGSAVSCGNGVFYNIDPIFEDTLAGDFRLKNNSPFIDVGDNAMINTTNVEIDLNHQQRIYNGVVDLGAIEYIAPYTAPIITSHPQSITLCEESILTLNVSTSGTPPLTFQWFKNGSQLSNATDSILSINTVNVLDAGNYYCAVMSTLDTVDSNPASVTVDEMLIPVIELVVDDLTICEGETLILNTTDLNGGANPIYNWYVNDSLVTGNLNSIGLENLNDEDQITIEMISSMDCVQPTSVQDTLEINIAPILSASMNIAGPDSIVCFGDDAEFVASFVNGGQNPAFSWFVNDVEIEGQNSEIFISSNLLNNDKVNCRLVSSEECIAESTVYSNDFYAQIDSCSLVSAINILDNKSVQIIPNPSNGDFSLKTYGLTGDYTLRVIDMKGVLLQEKILNLTESTAINLSITDKVGIFVVMIYNENNLSTQKIIIN